MSLGTALPTCDSFQYSGSDGLGFDLYGPVQSGMMYDNRRRCASFAASSTSLPPVFDVRCNSYEYRPSPPYSTSVINGSTVGQYSIKTSHDLGATYGQGLSRVHGQTTPVNHAGTPPQAAIQPGFAIYPWMRSMTAGWSAFCVNVDTYEHERNTKYKKNETQDSFLLQLMCPV